MNCAQLERVATKLLKYHPRWGKVFYQHDNARPHVHKNVKAKLEKLGWEKLEHPAYTPDLAPLDYHLFLSLSNDLRGRKYKEEKELKQYPDEFFASKSHTSEASQTCLEDGKWS